MAPFLDVKANQVTWHSHYTSNSPSPTTLTSYTTYTSTSTHHRGFCSTCGSTLTWRADSTPDEIEILIGTLDEDVLRGKWGRRLVECEEHYWASNCVQGVTDREGMGGKGVFCKEGSRSEVVEG
ncbi:hypothetical protein ACLMJK_004644 [Lecanora helva]